MRIDQINMTYDALEDRILLRVRTQDAVLAVLMITRRLTRGLVDGLLRSAAQGVSRVSPAAADPMARREVLAFEHQARVQASDFEKPFNPEGRSLFGEQPVLVSEVRLDGGGAANRWQLRFTGRDKQRLDMALDAQGLHAVIKLFEDLLPQTGWDIAMPSLRGEATAAGQVAH
ncbi:MAG TPA: hypothetical protein PLW81_15870 [Thiobacillaceae bacterium]|nr:hypothetical protein [Thiobacillaceae bacterium]